MIKQLATRLKEKDIILEVDQAVQAFLSDEGFDPLYGARPLRRAIMKYLEDDLAEQCLSQTLYPDTKIIVRRKKADDLPNSFTNELEVIVNFDDVNPDFLKSNETESDNIESLELTEQKRELESKDNDILSNHSHYGNTPHVPRNSEKSEALYQKIKGEYNAKIQAEVDREAKLKEASDWKSGE